MPFAVRTLLLLLSLGLPHIASAGEAERPEHMVYLRTIDPGIAQDIRYASAHNFTGHPLDGYAAPECLLSVKLRERDLFDAFTLAGVQLDRAVEVFDPLLDLGDRQSLALLADGVAASMADEVLVDPAGPGPGVLHDQPPTTLDAEHRALEVVVVLT